MAVIYQSSLKNQLRAYERRIRGIVQKEFRAAAGRWQKRVRNEWLSGPPGIFSGAKYGTTGMTRRSVSKRVESKGSDFIIRFHVGGHAPKYPNVANGVTRVSGEEARSALAAIRAQVAAIELSSRVPIFAPVLDELEAALPELPDVATLPLRDRHRIQRSRQRFVKRAKREARKRARKRGLFVETVGATGRRSRKLTEAGNSFVSASVKRRIQRNWKKPRVGRR